MTKRILYVEDEKFFADTLKKVLEAAGYEVALAEDGEQGLKLAREWKPNLILLDLLLPKVEGFEVLKQLQADLATKSIPVLVFSNLNSEADVQKAKSLGAQNFYVKALTMPNTILATVKEVAGPAS